MPTITVTYTNLHALPDPEIAKLSVEEVRRSDNFRANRRRQEYLCGRALLRNTLQLATGEPAASFKLAVDAQGKPMCEDGPAVTIAHTGNVVICAVTQQGQIGIDIELPHGRHRETDIAQRYFAADEVEWLAKQSQDRFYMLWVLKEAWLKAIGTGIAGGLGRLRCFVSPPVIDARVSDDATPALSLHSMDNALIGVATTFVPPTRPAIYYWDSAAGQFEDDNKVRLVAATR